MSYIVKKATEERYETAEEALAAVDESTVELRQVIMTDAGETSVGVNIEDLRQKLAPKNDETE